MNVLQTRHLSVTIGRSLEDVVDFLSKPENLAHWAQGLGEEFIATGDGGWQISLDGQTMTLRFAPSNDFGVFDHTLTTNDGKTFMNPMRAFANGDGTEVVFTLFRRPEMTDEDYARDAEWIIRDLARLKRYLETYSEDDA